MEIPQEVIAAIADETATRTAERVISELSKRGVILLPAMTEADRQQVAIFQGAERGA